MPFGNLAGNNSGLTDIDESSMDNNSSTVNTSGGNLNSSSSEVPNILQTAIDKNILSEALDIITSLQFDGHNNNDMANNFKSEVKDDPDDEAADEIDDFEDELSALMDGPMLNEHEIAFNLQPPTIVPHYLNFHYICESGSRILFLSIFWIKKFRCFRLLRFVSISKTVFFYWHNLAFYWFFCNFVILAATTPKWPFFAIVGWNCLHSVLPNHHILFPFRP